MARTDARATEDFKGAVARAQKYVEAGADAIFPEALQSLEEFNTFVREVPVPLLANMTEFGKSPLLSFDELSDLGYRMVIFPMSAFRVAMKASDKFFRDLKAKGTQKEWLEKNADAERALRIARLRSWRPRAGQDTASGRTSNVQRSTPKNSRGRQFNVQLQTVNVLAYCGFPML